MRMKFTAIRLSPSPHQLLCNIVDKGVSHFGVSLKRVHTQPDLRGNLRYQDYLA